MDNNAYQISHEELIKQYKQSLEFLANFKGVLQTLSHIANHIQGYIQTFFLLLEEVGINTSEENIAFICINLLYFVSGMVFLLFINAANTCKYIFICLIVFNALSQIFNMEIPLIPLNIFLWMAYGGLLFSYNTKIFKYINR